MKAKWFAFEYPPFPNEVAKPGPTKPGPIFVHLVREGEEGVAACGSKHVIKVVTLAGELRGFMPVCVPCLSISEVLP